MDKQKERYNFKMVKQNVLVKMHVQPCLYVLWAPEMETKNSSKECTKYGEKL